MLRKQQDSSHATLERGDITRTEIDSIDDILGPGTAEHERIQAFGSFTDISRFPQSVIASRHTNAKIQMV